MTYVTCAGCAACEGRGGHSYASRGSTTWPPPGACPHRTFHPSECPPHDPPHDARDCPECDHWLALKQHAQERPRHEEYDGCADCVQRYGITLDSTLASQEQPHHLRAALVRLLAVAMTEEEDVSPATQDEWIAAIKQANEALDQ